MSLFRLGKSSRVPPTVPCRSATAIKPRVLEILIFGRTDAGCQRGGAHTFQSGTQRRPLCPAMDISRLIRMSTCRWQSLGEELSQKRLVWGWRKDGRLVRKAGGQALGHPAWLGWQGAAATAEHGCAYLY